MLRCGMRWGRLGGLAHYQLRSGSLRSRVSPVIPDWVPTERDSRSKCLPSSQVQSHFPVDNPATGEVIAHVADFTSTEALAAVERGAASQPAWAFMTIEERSRLLMQWCKLITEHRLDLASLIVLEMGKPLAQALGEITYATSFLEFYCEQAKRLHGEIIPDPRSHQRKLLLQWEPVGVAGLITPWNFPVAMILRKASPALAVGCSVVLKPSEDTPLSALALAELWSQVDGLPGGIFNVVPCSRKRAAEIGDVLCTHDAIAAVSVTGSTQTGKTVMNRSSGTLKRMSLELGGNAPLIVFPSANLDMAVKGCMVTKFRNSGQTCVCANRIYVHADVHDEFVARLGGKIRQLKVGDGFDEDVDIGPLINERGVEKVESLVNASVDAGAKVEIGGKRWRPDSNFYEPTLLTGVTSSMPCARGEIFGPVASVIRYGEGMDLRDSEECVLQQANDSRSGLAAYFFSEDYRQIWRVSQRLQYGIVGANEAAVTMDVAPSSGRKESGIGMEGSHHAFADYVDAKYICMGGNFDMTSS